MNRARRFAIVLLVSLACFPGGRHGPMIRLCRRTARS